MATPPKKNNKTTTAAPAPQSRPIPWVLCGETISCTINGQPTIVDNTNKNFKNLVQALKVGDWDKAHSILNIKEEIESFGDVALKGGVIYYKEQEVNNVAAQRIIDIKAEGGQIMPMIKFLDNVMQNPLQSAQEELYLFLKDAQLPITEDGCFMAYKRIRYDYKDIHSGKFSNHIGATVTMDRKECDTSRHSTCSTGLHFCSLPYLANFSHHSDSDRVVIVKVNPKDVTAIPSDYNNEKGRCCKYTVVAEYGFAKDVLNQHAFENLVITTESEKIIEGKHVQGKTTDRFVAEKKKEVPKAPPISAKDLTRIEKIEAILENRTVQTKVKFGELSEKSIRKADSDRIQRLYEKYVVRNECD